MMARKRSLRKTSAPTITRPPTQKMRDYIVRYISNILTSDELVSLKFW